MSTPEVKVQSLSLKQFTAFEEAKFVFSPSINVLIGENFNFKIGTDGFLMRYEPEHLPNASPSIYLPGVFIKK